MEDDEFYLTVFRYFLIGFCVLVICSFGSCQNSKYQLRKMAEKHGPMESACAIDYWLNGADNAACGAALRQ